MRESYGDLRKPKAPLQLKTRDNKIVNIDTDLDPPHIRKEKHIQMILNKNDDLSNKGNNGKNLNIESRISKKS